jgi:hypothetical protein
MEELRTKAEYKSANDPPGLPQAAAQKIVNRLLEPIHGVPISILQTRYPNAYVSDRFHINRIPLR